MVSDRAPWDAIWTDVANYAIPRKTMRSGDQVGPGINPADKLHDTTAIDSASILASGHASAITPAGTQWFAWEAPDEIKSDEADAWYNKASEIARKILSAGNFHTSLNESFEDRSGFGISTMAIMPDAVRKVTFQGHPVGSYTVEEDAEGNVDTIYLERMYDIRQFVGKFGEKALAFCPKLAKSWERFRIKGENAQHPILHCVVPRLDRDSKLQDAVNMPWASVWISVHDKAIFLESGFPEFPFVVTRYLKRTGSRQQYGYSPFEQCRAAILDANRIKQILKVVGQKIAVPPVIVPDTLVGNVDTRPGGRTVVKSTSAMLPQEWLTKGDPRGLMEELLDARECIRKAYHTDLFRMFADREKEMTAREVTELAAEKLMPFSPSFTRFTADFQPGMERIFCVLFRAGAFGNPNELPKAVISKDNEGNTIVPAPKVVYQSRIALAIRNFETAAADRMVERALGVAQVDPSILDSIDMDSYIRLSARNDGVSEDVLRPKEMVQQLRDQRAQQAEEQRQLEQAQQAAQAAGAVGMKVPPPQ